MAIYQCTACGMSVVMQKAPLFNNKPYLVPAHHGLCDQYLCTGTRTQGVPCPIHVVHDCLTCPRRKRETAKEG